MGSHSYISESIFLLWSMVQFKLPCRRAELQSRRGLALQPCHLHTLFYCIQFCAQFNQPTPISPAAITDYQENQSLFHGRTVALVWPLAVWNTLTHSVYHQPALLPLPTPLSRFGSHTQAAFLQGPHKLPFPDLSPSDFSLSFHPDAHPWKQDPASIFSFYSRMWYARNITAPISLFIQLLAVILLHDSILLAHTKQFSFLLLFILLDQILKDLRSTCHILYLFLQTYLKLCTWRTFSKCLLVRTLRLKFLKRKNRIRKTE